jgi:hypothetical protein
MSLFTRKKKVIVDGANIAYLQRTHNGKPLAVNIFRVKRELEKKRFLPIIIVDASLYHEVADQDKFEELIDLGEIELAPDDTDTETFIIEAAHKYRAPIISNDLYEEYQDQYPWIEDRRIPLVLSGDLEVEFYQLGMGL